MAAILRFPRPYVCGRLTHAGKAELLGEKELPGEAFRSRGQRPGASPSLGESTRSALPSLLIKNIGEFFTGDIARPQAQVGSLLVARRSHRRARSAGPRRRRPRARRRRLRRHAGPGRRPHPPRVRRMDADAGHPRLDRQLRAWRHHDDDLGLRAARARARLRESHARARHLARRGHRLDHRPRALERRQGACRHRDPGAGHDRAALRPARRGRRDPRQVHLLSARRPAATRRCAMCAGATSAASR